jgi:hypothetical protein
MAALRRHWRCVPHFVRQALPDVAAAPWVRTWTPQAGPQPGCLVTHAEAISIAGELKSHCACATSAGVRALG